MIGLIRKITRNLEKKRWNKYRNLSIGDNTHVELDNLDGITPQLVVIGRNCVFAPKSVVLTHDACLLPYSGKYVFRETRIGDNVFVGYGAVILPGIKVESNVVIGANSVVTKDVAGGLVVAGNPAKIICTTKELYEKKEKFLSEASFNWKQPITNREIYKQQKIMGLHDE